MRNFMRFLAAFFVGVAGTLTVQAQEEEEQPGWHLDQPLISEDSQFSSEHADRDEGRYFEYLIDGDMSTFWHADWHSDYAAPHSLVVDLTKNIDSFVGIRWGRRNYGNSQCIRMMVEEQKDGQWCNIGTFEMPYSGAGQIDFSPAFPVNAQVLRFTSLANNTNNDYGNTWHCAEFQLYPVDADVAAPQWLMSLYEAYYDYLTGDADFDLGTDYGQYSDVAAYNAFIAALNEAEEYIATEDFPTGDALMALCNNIVDNYNKILASEVLFQAEDGYYRINTALMYFATDEEGYTVDVQKDIYATLQGKAYWGTRDENDARHVWKLTNVPGGILLVNTATDQQMAEVVNGEMTMSNEDMLMAMDFAGVDDEGRTLIDIRFAKDARDPQGGTYLHQQGHSHGTGAGQALSTWRATWNMGESYESDNGTSEWYLEPVSADEAQALIDAFALTKNHDLLVLKYQELLEEANDAITLTKDYETSYAVDTESPCISSTNQFSSLWTDAYEGSFDGLLDGDSNTFWHSDWHNAASGPHIHSFEVTFDEPIAAGVYEAYILRRATSNSHMALMSLYGTNDASLLTQESDMGWDLICKSVSTPWYSGQSDVYSQPFETKKAYKYWRFFEEATDGDAGYVYWGYSHLGDFQIYPASKIADSQFDNMGEVATNLQALVDQGESMDYATLTVEQYNALLAALKAFRGAMVDPSALRDAMTAASSELDKFIVGEDPGYWSDGSTADALQDAIDEVDALLKSAKYTREDIENYMTRLEEARAAYISAINPVRTDMWYNLGVAPESMYEQYGWGTGAAPMYEWVVTPGYRDEEGQAVAYDRNEIKEGVGLYFMDKEWVNDSELSQFRFVQVTDTTYAMQNRATGLYLSRSGDWSVGQGQHLSKIPVQIKVTHLGYGENLFREYRMDGETWEKFNLNVWHDSKGGELASWNDVAPGCNSALCLYTVEPVDESYEAIVNQTIDAKTTRIECSPVELTLGEGSIKSLYLPVGTYEDEGTKYLALNVAEEDYVPAGVPFFVVNDKEEDAAYTVVLGTKIATEPQQSGGVQGLYYDTKVDAGCVQFVDGQAVTLEQNTKLSGNNGYLQYGLISLADDADYVISIAIDGDPTSYDAIQSALADVTTRGTVYSLSGAVMMKNATLNDLRGLERGIYILNGRKVRVSK